MRWDNHGAHVAGGKTWSININTGTVYTDKGARDSRSRSRAVRRALQAGAERNGNLLVWDGQTKRKRKKQRGDRVRQVYVSASSMSMMRPGMSRRG